MNLLFRLFGVLLHSLFKSGLKNPLDPVILSFRVMPHDLDINFHMNNGRYLTLMDLGRVELMLRMGIFGHIIKKGWMPVVGGVEMLYKKPLAPFQRFRLETKVLAWDEKWFFIEQTFYVKDTLMARGLVKGLIRGKNKNIPADELLKLGNYPPTPSPAPPHFFTDQKKV